MKSKIDTNILYNKKTKEYGYDLYAKKGDVVIIDEKLVDELVSIYGEDARCDCTGVTQEFIIYFIAYLERQYNFVICKFGLDPNKANKIESYFNANVKSIDGKDVVIKFQMEKAHISNPILELMKDYRNQGVVYNNNKLTELHIADVQVKETANGFKFANSNKATRKDGVIAEASAESAYNVFTTNKFTGSKNVEILKQWWLENGQRVEKEIL